MSVQNDSFLAFSSPGVVNAVTETDLRVMDVLGWDLASPAGDISGSDGGGGGFADAPQPLGKAPHHDDAVA